MKPGLLAILSTLAILLLTSAAIADGGERVRSTAADPNVVAAKKAIDAKAEEHLAALNRICGIRCEEFRDLAREIAEYKNKRS